MYPPKTGTMMCCLCGHTHLPERSGRGKKTLTALAYTDNINCTEPRSRLLYFPHP